MSLDFESKTSILQMGPLSFVIESKASMKGIKETVLLFNFVSGLYETMDQRTANIIDQVVTLTPTNPGRFVQAGTGLMRAKVVLTNTRPVAFDVSIDRIGWFTKP
jgi:hypothetical protein